MLLAGEGQGKELAFHLLNARKSLFERIAGSKRARALPHHILQLRLKRDGWEPTGIPKTAGRLGCFDELLCVPAFPPATDFHGMIGGIATGGLSEDQSFGNSITG